MWPKRPPMPEFNNEVVITAQFEDSNNMQPRIVGYTNLPDGTRLHLNLIRQAAFFNYEDNEILVLNGRFQSRKMLNAISATKTPVPPGQYNLRIFLPVGLSWQNASVNNILGERGRKLHGELVDSDTDNLSPLKIAEYKTVLQLGDEESAEADKKVREQRQLEFKAIDDAAIARYNARSPAAKYQCSQFIKQHAPSEIILDDYNTFPTTISSECITLRSILLN